MSLARLAVAGSAPALLTAVPPAPAADLPACAATPLFRDDFSRFPPGWLSRPVMMNGTLNGAIQEYHYLSHRGVPLGPWASAICHLDSWVAGDEDGVPYLEQHLARTAPQFSTPRAHRGQPGSCRRPPAGREDAADGRVARARDRPVRGRQQELLQARGRQ